VLHKEGYSTICADNGPDARALAESEKPDIILLDIVMPGETGFDVIKWLKARSSTASIPVLFISGEDDIESKIKSFELGGVDYIVKPFNIEEVKARIRTHIRLSQATSA